MQALFVQDQDSSSDEEEEDQRRQSSVPVLHADCAYARDPLLASAMPMTQEVEELYDEVSVSLRWCDTVLAAHCPLTSPPPHSARTLCKPLPRHSARTLCHSLRRTTFERHAEY
jgi:hypothetical protein